MEYLSNGGILQPLLGWLTDQEIKSLRLVGKELAECERPFKSLHLREDNYGDGVSGLYGDVERIRFSGLKLGDAEVVKVIGKFPRVVEVVLDRMDMVSDRCLELLGESMGERMRCLEVLDCYLVTPGIVRRLWELFPRLEKLVLDQVPFEDADLDHLVVTQMWDLKSLVVRGAEISTLGVPWVLEELEIVGCQNHGWNFMGQLDLSRVKRLWLEGKMGGINGMVFLDQEMGRLEELILKGVRLDKFGYWPVRKLEGSGKISQVARKCHSLEELVWHDRISGADVEMLRRGCVKLRYLRIKLRDLTQEAEDKLVEKFPGIELDLVGGGGSGFFGGSVPVMDIRAREVVNVGDGPIELDLGTGKFSWSEIGWPMGMLCMGGNGNDSKWQRMVMSGLVILVVYRCLGKYRDYFDMYKEEWDVFWSFWSLAMLSMFWLPEGRVSKYVKWFLIGGMILGAVMMLRRCWKGLRGVNWVNLLRGR